MKCIAHKAEAVAVCAYCGRALCQDCIQTPTAVRMVCSTECAAALARGERAMQMVLQQGVQNARASAFYCYLCGGLSAVAAVVAWFMLPSPFLILFTAGCALVLVVSGVWYGSIARRHTSLELIPAPTTLADAGQSHTSPPGGNSEQQQETTVSVGAQG
jgi:hypothetical protein